HEILGCALLPFAAWGLATRWLCRAHELSVQTVHAQRSNPARRAHTFHQAAARARELPASRGISPQSRRGLMRQQWMVLVMLSVGAGAVADGDDPATSDREQAISEIVAER